MRHAQAVGDTADRSSIQDGASQTEEVDPESNKSRVSFFDGCADVGRSPIFREWRLACRVTGSMYVEGF